MYNNLEILTSGEYSIYSDVFAFGMLMWEIVSRNSRPFGGNLGWIEIASKIKKGKRPTIPIDCPIQIKNLIERCWNQEAKQRLTMQQIIEYLQNLSKPQNQYVDNSISQVLNQQKSDSTQQQQQYKEIITSNPNDLNNNNNKKQTLRMKQKQNLEIYLKEIGIEIEEDDEEWQQVIDTFVSQKITPNVLKSVNVEDLEKSFEKLKIAIGFQSQLLAAIKASKVCVEVEILAFIFLVLTILLNCCFILFIVNKTIFWKKKIGAEAITFYFPKL